MRTPVQKRKGESGQAVILVLLALSIFLFLAIGLAIDASHMYAQRQMAQAAADAGAQAGILSSFDDANTGQHAFLTTTGTHPCTSADPTPCFYAETLNGFSNPGDAVNYTIPNPSSVNIGAGNTLSNSGSVNLLQVTVQRDVPLTFMSLLLGPGATRPVRASGTAAILDVKSPIPILVLHPTMQGAFTISGNGSPKTYDCDGNPEAATIVICGGPEKSIQVNSLDPTCSVSGNPNNCAASSGLVDLSQAGPDGTGANFGNRGGPTACPGSNSCPTMQLGSGAYQERAAPIDDPLWSLSAPPKPTTIRSGYSATEAPNQGDCPANLTTLTGLSSCVVFFAGYYPNGISVGGGGSKGYAIFTPGIYYIGNGGFQLNSNSIARMAYSSYNGYNTDQTSSSDPAHTNWTLHMNPDTGSFDPGGMLVYNSPQSPVQAGKDNIHIDSNSGQIGGPTNTFPDANCPNGGNCLVGANGGVLSSSVCDTTGAAAAMYYGVLFFQDHGTAVSITHQISGGAGLTIKGTIYLTHGKNNVLSDGTYQTLNLGGNSGSRTTVQGEIIVDALGLNGTPNITMILSSFPCYTVRKIALVQ